MIICIECGNEISSETRSCPKCHTYYPSGTECKICNLKEKASLYPGGFAHPHCIEEVNRESEVKGTCSSCRHDVIFVFGQRGWNYYDCPDCGYPTTIPT